MSQPAPPPGAPRGLIGFLDALRDGSMVVGWASDPTDKTARPVIRLMRGVEVLAECGTDAQRDDGNPGFRLVSPTPLTPQDFLEGRVRIRAMLPGRQAATTLAMTRRMRAALEEAAGWEPTTEIAPPPPKPTPAAAPPPKPAPAAAPAAPDPIQRAVPPRPPPSASRGAQRVAAPADRGTTGAGPSGAAAEPAPPPRPPAPRPAPEPAGTVPSPAPMPAPRVEPAPIPVRRAEPAPMPAPRAEPTPMPAPRTEPAPPPALRVEPAPMPAPRAEPAPMPAPRAEPAPMPAPRVEPTPIPASGAKPAAVLALPSAPSAATPRWVPAAAAPASPPPSAPTVSPPAEPLAVPSVAPGLPTPLDAMLHLAEPLRAAGITCLHLVVPRRATVLAGLPPEVLTPLEEAAAAHPALAQGWLPLRQAFARRPQATVLWRADGVRLSVEGGLALIETLVAALGACRPDAAEPLGRIATMLGRADLTALPRRDVTLSAAESASPALGGSFFGVAVRETEAALEANDLFYDIPPPRPIGEASPGLEAWFSASAPLPWRVLLLAAEGMGGSAGPTFPGWWLRHLAVECVFSEALATARPEAVIAACPDLVLTLAPEPGWGP